MRALPFRDVQVVIALIGCGLVFSVLGGIAVSQELLYVLPFAAISALVFLVSLGRRTERIFIVALAIVLFGFLLQGRAFAYIGLPPLYVGEIVLFLGIAAALLSQIRLRHSALSWLLGGYLFLGIVRTIPYWSEYGVAAIRDAALWYYSGFALLVVGFLTRERLLWFMGKYSLLIPFILGMYAVMPALGLLIGDVGLRVPGSDLQIPSEIKPGDRAVFLVGIAAIVSSGTLGRFNLPLRTSDFVFWLLWLSSVASVMVQNRGGLLAIVLGVGVAQLLKPTYKSVKLLFLGASVLIMFLLINPTLDFGGSRVLSSDQLVTNVLSIFTDDTENLGSVQGTKDWRLEWWREIAEDTLGGPLTLNGHGFGVNLADEYGFQVYEDGSLRSPHNSHITVLARMGLPGLVIWIVLQGTFAFQMVGSFRIARKANLAWSPVLVWLIAIWIAAIINSSFDVYLEGPQGAIPFWCVFGAGMAVMKWIREDIANLNSNRGGPVANTTHP